MPRRPRLMYIATSSGTGGAERQVRDLSLRMHASGWEVSVVSMLPLESAFADLPAAGVATTSLSMRQGIADPRGLIRLASLLRDRRPDVLHAHMVHANLLARLSRLVRRTPVVLCTIHSQYQGRGWRNLAYRGTDRLCDVTTAVSRVAMEDAIRLGAVVADRVSTVPNGIDLAHYGPDDAARIRTRHELGVDEEFVFLAVGRFAAAKDYPNLIRAFARLRKTHRRGRLLIVGGGSPGESRAYIREEGLAPHVELLGERQDVPDLMRAADAYVMSSAWEGLPLVMLEAGASQLPVVTTDVGGNREAVEDGVTGIVVPPRDAAALADGMARMLDLDSRERAAMGRAGRELVTSSFDIDAVVARWTALYTSLLERRSGRANRGLA